MIIVRFDVTIGMHKTQTHDAVKDVIYKLCRRAHKQTHTHRENINTMNTENTQTGF